MNKYMYIFNKEMDVLEKTVTILFLLIPFALCISILVAEIFSSLIALIFIFWCFNKKNFFTNYIDIKIPILIILFFFFNIIITLVMSNDFNKSFLPSFFYFRFLFLSLGIFYILKIYKVSLKLLLISLLTLFTLILLDSFYEILQINNLFGLSIEKNRIDSGTHFHLTSFFGDEKKLGSFLIRLLPLTLSLMIFLNFKILKIKNLENYIIIFSGILIFLSTERTAMFFYLILLILLWKMLEKKIFIFSYIVILITIIGLLQPKIVQKHVNATLSQLGLTKYNEAINKDNKLNFSKINYLSKEHEQLIRSGYEIFKENPLTGSGIKTYHETCKEIKKRKSLDIKCSTHPHNTYIQILSDTGIFAAAITFFIFSYIFMQNFKLFFKSNLSKNLKSLYILNLGIMINLMPLVPSGSFYNNWINLMIYFPICFWFYLISQIKLKKQNI
ncbi:O-antigen ligase family protein [Candidatus Pelagibacter sp.]|nr:O-antigen ligase family protein [Candidatus Pelagibacter sp.]